MGTTTTADTRKYPQISALRIRLSPATRGPRQSPSGNISTKPATCFVADSIVDVANAKTEDAEDQAGIDKLCPPHNRSATEIANMRNAASNIPES